jgi:4-amino-4-deoxy-L-arabinose transferase
MAVITYLFYSFVKTKMPSFPIITSLLIFIPLATLVDYGLGFISKIKVPGRVKMLMISIVIVSLFYFRFDIEEIQAKHTLWKKENSYTRMLSHNREIFNSLDLPENTVVFNVKGQHYIEMMFYTGLPSYRFVPSFEQFQDVKQKGRNIAIFLPADRKLPDYIEEDNTVIVLEEQLQGYN